MIIIKKYKKKVDEEDAQQVAAKDNAAVSADEVTRNKLTTLNQNKATELNNKRIKQTEYENAIRVIDGRLNNLNKEIANLGGTVSDNESLSPVFYKNLYESVLNKKDEMFAMVSVAFSEIETLSYTPNNTRCMTYARALDEIFSKMNDGTVTEDVFNDVVRGVLDRSQISFSNKEKIEFIKNLWELIKENPVFKVKIKIEN